MKREKIKKGDRVRLKTQINGAGTTGTLQNWRYNKESGVISIDIKPDGGIGYYFMGTKKDFTMEKLNDTVETNG
jgi:hypothetical protein